MIKINGVWKDITTKYVKIAGEICPSILNKKNSPHVLRHTCALVMLQATKDIRKVSLWLCHSGIPATEVYLRTDPTEKLKAIKAITPPTLQSGNFRPPYKLIATLTGGDLS